MEILGVLSRAPISFVVLLALLIFAGTPRGLASSQELTEEFREIRTQVMSSAWWSYRLGQNAKEKSLCWDRTGCTVTALKTPARSGRRFMAQELHPQFEELGGTVYEKVLDWNSLCVQEN